MWIARNTRQWKHVADSGCPVDTLLLPVRGQFATSYGGCGASCLMKRFQPEP